MLGWRIQGIGSGEAVGKRGGCKRGHACVVWIGKRWGLGGACGRKGQQGTPTHSLLLGQGRVCFSQEIVGRGLRPLLGPTSS